jgi:exopolyphosphatase/guanosine-5'-triphosphate,3'-diphosphate pyrophosphatase
MAIHTFAAIDIGSFELELSIFETTGKGEIRRLDRLRHVIALGSDTYATGLISYELIDELCEVLNGFKEVIRGYQIESKNVMVCATSAMREAKNRFLVEDQIRVRCGLEVTVLSNSEQRFLCYKAIPVWQKQFYKIIEKESAIVDVGFGSMQISLYAKGALQSTQNIKLGALRIWSFLSKLSDSGQGSMTMAEDLIDNEIDTFKNYYLKDKNVKNIIAIGDCMRIFAAKVMKLSKADSFSAEDFVDIYQRVQGMSASDLAMEYDVPTEFAALVLPVAMIYYRIIRVTGAQTVWIPVTALSEGMAADWAEKQRLIRLEHDFTEDILSEARHLNKHYMGNKEHTVFAETKCLAVFDATRKLHGMGKRERLLLQLAAILHDCGKYISMTAPGQCAYDIIMAAEILGIKHEERKILANVVKYNTTELDGYEEMHLPRKTCILIYKLIAMLRLVNAMDRSHKQKLSDAAFTLRDGKLVITTNTDQDISLERGMLEEKGRFFEEVFGVLPELKVRKK